MNATRTLLVSILLGVLFVSRIAVAQVAPSSSEVAAYRGLHAAAAKGDTTEIARLVKAGSPIDARDSRARTPLHVATYMRRPDAARALMRLGADPNALEAQQYDIVTIAAVANDVPMLKVALEGGCKATNVTSPLSRDRTDRRGASRSRRGRAHSDRRQGAARSRQQSWMDCTDRINCPR